MAVTEEGNFQNKRATDFIEKLVNSEEAGSVTVYRNIAKNNYIDPKDLAGLSKINQNKSVLKLITFLAIGTFLSIMILCFDNSIIISVCQIFMGILFLHGLELQHECLHRKFFYSKILNDAVGFLLGLPMAVSFSHYQLQHLHHHRCLGTSNDEELFGYKSEVLSELKGFLLRAWNIQRVPVVIWNFLIKRDFPVAFCSANSKVKVLTEYTLIFTLLLCALLIDFANKEWFFLKIWIIPWIAFSEPLHFLVELPEHLYCDRDSTDVMLNTRTVLTNPVFRYIVNSNNYHVEHHLYPTVAFDELHLVNNKIRHNLVHYSSSYRKFFRELFIRQCA